jgi:hypothetical protein
MVAVLLVDGAVLQCRHKISGTGAYNSAHKGFRGNVTGQRLPCEFRARRDFGNIGLAQTIWYRARQLWLVLR